MDLLCAEALCGDRMDCNFAEVDPNLIRDPRVINNLLLLERTTIPHLNYFVHMQNDLQPFMRKVVTTWMLEVCEEQLCEEQVFPLAVNFLDRFLCLCPISRQQLQLVGATTLLLASKIRQCYALTVDLLCAYTDNSISAPEVRSWELVIVSKLNWNLSGITGFDYVDHILERVPWGTENPLTKRHAHTLVSVCYTEPEFMQSPPSLLASACICAAARGLRSPSAVFALGDVCRLTRADPVMTELMVRHIEHVVAKETASLQQVPKATSLPSAPNPGKLVSSCGEQPETPTDIQDVHF